MTIEVTFDDDEAKFVEDYLQQTNLSISKVARQAILEMIFQDDTDLAAFEEAMERYKKNPVTYTHAEVKKSLGMA
jgi:hypothetical protein